MKILITGGLGFLGSNISKSLLNNTKHEIFVFDNLSRIGANLNCNWLSKNRKIRFYKIDIRNFKKISSKIKNIKPDFILHFAGQVTMTKSIENPRNDFSINVIGTMNIIESIRIFSPKSKIIYSSTNKVYGDLNTLKYVEKKTRYVLKNHKQSIDEKTPLNFQSPYGCSKGSAEQYILDYSRIYGLQVCVFRHSSMYGSQQYPTFDQGWIGWFALEAFKIKYDNKKYIEIAGNGKQVRDILNIKDMVNLYFKAIKNFNKISGKAYNIGGGYKNSLSIIELLIFLEEQLKIKIKIKKNKIRESDQKIFIADIKKIKKDINWYPIIDYKKGLKNYLKWINKLRIDSLK